MPTYEYRCHSCNQITEAFQSINATPLKKCPKCAEDTLQRGIGGGIGLSFKGSGFYITDYKSSNNQVNENKSSDLKAADSAPSACCPCSKISE